MRSAAVVAETDHTTGNRIILTFAVVALGAILWVAMGSDTPEAPSGASDDPRDWYAEQGVTHAHCPCGCEHPQPFILNGKLVCGVCAIQDGKICEMVPCTPDVCD